MVTGCVPFNSSFRSTQNLRGAFGSKIERLTRNQLTKFILVNNHMTCCIGKYWRVLRLTEGRTRRWNDGQASFSSNGIRGFQR